MTEGSRKGRPIVAVLVAVGVTVTGAVLLALAAGRGDEPTDSQRTSVRVASAEQVSAPGREPRAPTGELAIGDRVPTLTLPELGGRRHALREHRGRVVVLNFWASWCPPCIREMPSLQQLHERQWPELSVVTVAADESPATVRGLARRMGLTFPILLDPEGRACASWGTVMFPETWIVSPDGHVLERLIGEQDWTEPTLVSRLRAHGRAVSDGDGPG